MKKILSLQKLSTRKNAGTQSAESLVSLLVCGSELSLLACL
ncbi:SapB/AmfS family lanthipeptide [Sorangium sp. So ce233]